MAWKQLVLLIEMLVVLKSDIVGSLIKNLAQRNSKQSCTKLPLGTHKSHMTGALNPSHSASNPVSYFVPGKRVDDPSSWSVPLTWETWKECWGLLALTWASLSWGGHFGE